MRSLQRRRWQAPLVSQPARETGRVVIAGLGPDGFMHQGKVQAEKFFPDFCDHLSTQGIATVFACTVAELKEAITARCVVIHVFPETKARVDHDAVLDAQRGAALIFNHPLMGPYLARKDETHRLLTRNGIPMPPMNPGEGTVFSNHMNASSAPVSLLPAGSELDRSRYNTRFIDTRVVYEGTEYYSTVRLLCVGRVPIHGFVRARPTSEGDPSVHAKDTHLDPGLLEYLQTTQVTSRLPELTQLAQRIGDVLGPGFYAHDLLVERETGRVHLCETGFKFHDWSYTDRIQPLAGVLPSHGWMFTPAFARQSAAAFLSEWRRLAGIEDAGAGGA